ncbi:MAG TPA: roadblock/LC7 domain-containing protein [Candidatus Obscuribacterales bacterium]
MADTAQIMSLLNTLNGKHGILGCLLVGRDGGVVASSLPPEVDVTMIGALSATLFSNNDVSIQRMNRGNLTQMTLLTDQGILHFYEAAGHFLVVLTAKGQKINLEGLIRSVEEQGKTLAQVIG